ncbi:MAG: hybrid sensor histidine kinase/response regulator [Methylococcaceae bacterium]|nr:hybrid sensor histidine kinase/response regulator [Methylococcaceae bacterium]
MLKTLRVLLVEDDEDDYVITRDLLSDADQTNYQLEWVSNSQDALTKLLAPQCTYDVCLLDYRLGSETSLDIMRKVIKEGVPVPMVLLTEHADRQIDLSAMQEGASDFMVKSEINSTSLDRVIRYVCAVKKHEQERLALALAVEKHKQAEAANKSKDEFLGMVSHELRGPINSILLWLELLKSPDSGQDTIKTAVETIERSVKQQSKILNDLVELSRGLNGMIKLYKQSVNLIESLRNTVINHQPEAVAKKISMTFTADYDEVLVNVDPERLQQILGNVLTNSIKFTPEQGRIDVNIKIHQIDNSSHAEIAIKDTGIGISSELLPVIFDRYLQAPTHSYSSNTGLGLGLTIARNLVALHNGTIRAESPGKNRGSTFYVTLPIKSLST